MIRTPILMTASLVVLGASPLHAEPLKSITVRVSDLNLHSPRDMRRLHDRVLEAASEVCGLPRLAVFVPAPPPEFMACRNATVAATLSRLRLPGEKSTAPQKNLTSGDF